MNAVTSRPAYRRAHPRPPFWVKLPVLAGNLLQLGGIVAGVLLVVAAASTIDLGRHHHRATWSVQSWP
jgi:hypothetical protein